MRIYYQLRGAHYHCRVFMHGKCGDLCVGQDDWIEFRASFNINFVTWIEEGKDNA